MWPSHIQLGISGVTASYVKSIVQLYPWQTLWLICPRSYASTLYAVQTSNLIYNLSWIFETVNNPQNSFCCTNNIPSSYIQSIFSFPRPIILSVAIILTNPQNDFPQVKNIMILVASTQNKQEKLHWGKDKFIAAYRSC